MDRWLNNIDSSTVLWGQFIIYTIYAVAIISLVAWFASKLSGTKHSKMQISPKLFYGWIIFLIVVGVGLHLTTLFTIPWSRVDLNGTGDAKATYNLTIGWDSNIGRPAWSIPVDEHGVATTPIQVCNGDLVKFSVNSVAEVAYTDDYATVPDISAADNGSDPSRPALTYGFGIFRQDSTQHNAGLVAQMQVVPGHANDLAWSFPVNGNYNIMSTEYSGPLGSDVTVVNAITVVTCGN